MDLVGRYKGRETKKCPRCGEKCLVSQPKCPECGLIFSRLDNVTNEAAKQRLKHKEKDKVLMMKTIPQDKKYWVLVLFSTLFGLFGAHFFYVYRWKTGLYMLISFVITVLFGVVFNSYAITWCNGVIMNSIIAPYVGVYAIIWLYTMLLTIFKKFRIPVSLPYREFKVEK